LLDDPAALVRGAAVWALGQLDSARLARCAQKYRAGESDRDVIDEWNAALGETDEARR
jgi:epoxyqueuosine reductase